MAFIEGYPAQDSSKSIMRHLAFMAIVMIVIVGFAADSSESLMEQLSSSAVPASIILGIMLYVSFKVNPKGWNRIINKHAYAASMGMDRQIAEKLLELDDTYFIIHNFTFELFHIDFLVISKYGIFVLNKTTSSKPLEIRDNILFQGGRTMETLTGNLWRICHLINIVLKKGYQVDVMPHPILVVPETEDLEVKTYEGIDILTPPSILDHLQDRKEDVLQPEISQGFSYYIKERYGPKK